MKKILLASACLLTLTACSMPNQHKQENKPKQNQSQSKAKEEEKVKTKTFSKKIDEYYTNSVKLFYTKDKILSFQLISSQAIPEENQKMSVEDLTKSYREDLKQSPMIEDQEKLKGLEIHVEISEDKKKAIAIFDFDLSKIDQEQLIQSADDSESSQTFFKKLQDKPDVVFDFLKGQGLKEE
ncbi:DUF1307 domain-containing protein [Streptococcus sanguinis]|uniref:DUF1307 domain-containing protein n=1 Tax=Streptococcus sanguinis TaxID=1305 RepID=UPI001CBD44F9|nr:DUF1307 domain-containing protein [Streptococcus sanguinis]MBZ2038471.1 DUF1307 domain-containing protein [Streptococcus sanguinis]MBZ2068595.1 DUF1307 domain-containing protein [Streptococcus sanguinis]MBZ2071040.1 DUF1307 domain-containing protein [Streptococcus sanguinis]